MLIPLRVRHLSPEAALAVAAGDDIPLAGPAAAAGRRHCVRLPSTWASLLLGGQERCQRQWRT